MTCYKPVDSTLCGQLVDAAYASDRKRSHHNFHEDLDDPVQRLCIGLVPGTYVRPHRHPEDYKWEMMLVIQGRVRMVLFDDGGKISDTIELSEQGPVRAIEIPPGTWHTLFPVEGPAVIMEIKQGPYLPLDDGNFATWAPREGEPTVDRFLKWCAQGEIGTDFEP